MPNPKSDDRTAFTSSDRIVVPSIAVERLRDCIQSRKDGKAGKEQIRDAVAPLCDEARRSQAMPEQLLVSLKELCHSLPEYEGMRGAVERNAFLDAVVTVAIEEYYRA